MADAHPIRELDNSGGNDHEHVVENENYQNEDIELADHHHHQDHHHDHYHDHQDAHHHVHHAEGQGEEAQENEDAEMDANLPAWALAEPVDGYIEHPVAGLVMHPSFYDNRRLIDQTTDPPYQYDREVDGPLCPAGQKCTHIKNCFEVRVRMAVLAYRRHNISFRDTEYIWRVSRSTIQRRKAALDKCSPILFLLTPEHSMP